jgi:hypothetical protein
MLGIIYEGWNLSLEELFQKVYIVEEGSSHCIKILAMDIYWN